MTQVTGILTDEVGTVLANTTCAVMAIDQIVGQGGGARVKRGAIVVTDGSGEFDADINPGVYELIVEVPTPADPNIKARRIGRMTVHGDTMTLEDALDRNAEPVTPTVLQDALAAAQAAADSAAASEADRILAQTAASNSAASASQADTFATQAELAALAAGAPIVTSLTDPVPADGTVELLKLDAGLQVYEVVAGAWVLRGWLVGPKFDTVHLMLGNTATALGPEGQIVEAGGFRYEVAASAATDHHVTTAGGVKLYVLAGADGVVNVDAFGAKGDGLTSDAGPVGVACANFRKVVCSPHRTYRFTEQVDVNDDLIFDFQGAQVIFGDGHLNLFNVLSAIDRLEIRNCGGVALEGVTLGDFAYKNFVSNRENTGTITGFPTGTLFHVKTFLLENCSIDASRVFVQAEESFRALNNEFVSSDYKVRPGSLVGLGDEFSLVQGNRFEADYHEDVLKGGRGRARITKNHFIHTGSGAAQVDIYSTIDKCNIVDNYLFNTQIHRKQTGGEGATVDRGFNVISGNNFDWTVSGYPIYFRGSEGVISNNVAKVTRPDTSDTAFVYVDAETENYDPSASTKGGFISITGNLCDYRGGEQTNGSFCRVNPGSSSPESLAIIVSNNLCRGGDRFMRGNVEVLSGNAWVDGASDGGADNHQIQIGNYMPSSGGITGKMSEGYNFLSVDSGAEDQVIDTLNRLFIRKSGGGSIDNLTGAKRGTVVTIFNRSGACTVKTNTNKIRLNGNVNFVMGTRHTLTLLKISDSDGGWQEISRTT